MNGSAKEENAQRQQANDNLMNVASKQIKGNQSRLKMAAINSIQKSVNELPNFQDKDMKMANMTPVVKKNRNGKIKVADKEKLKAMLL